MNFKKNAFKNTLNPINEPENIKFSKMETYFTNTSVQKTQIDPNRSEELENIQNSNANNQSNQDTNNNNPPSVQNSNEEQFLSSLTALNKEKKFSILLWNIQGSHFGKKLILNGINANVIGLLEPWKPYDLSSKHTSLYDKSEKTKLQSQLIAHESLNLSKTTNLNNFNNDFIPAKITIGKTEIRLILIYLHPSDLKRREAVLSEILALKNFLLQQDSITPLIIFGDWNTNLTLENAKNFGKIHQGIIKKITKNGNILSTTDYTYFHKGRNTKSLIDFFVLFNINGIIKIPPIEAHQSDHKPLIL